MHEHDIARPGALLDGRPTATVNRVDEMAAENVGCLDDATVYALVRGELPSGELPEVDRHMDGCDLCREVVIGTARTVGERVMPLRVGDRVGRYVITGELGRGGFGIVYEAADPSLDRRVAIKLMRSGVDRSYEERLIREAKAMARLNHPNVVTVFEVGQRGLGGEGAATYIVMERVHGVDLRLWLGAEPRSVEEIRDVFCQAGRGLAAAHEGDLLHRDFKPDNVIVGTDGRVRVTDFGLARGTGEVSGIVKQGELDGAGVLASLTVTGTVVGTPAYMAPEQLAGEQGSAKSDQYSFCVSLFEALHGRRPFEGDSFRELRERVLEGEVTSSGASVPRQLERAMLCGLQRDPAMRHPSMQSLVEALTVDPSRRWRRATALGVAASLAALAAFGLARSDAEVCTGGDALAASTWNPERADRVEAAFSKTGVDFAARTFQQVNAMLNRWRDDWAAAHEAACRATHDEGQQSEAALDARMGCLERQRKQVGALVAALEVTDRAGIGQSMAAVGALPALAGCADVASLSEIAPPAEAKRREVDQLEAAIADAMALVATGRLDEGKRDAEALVSRAEKLAYDPTLALAHGVTSDASRQLGDLTAAKLHASEGLWAARRARDWRAETHAWLRLAAIEGTRGELDSAETACRNAEAMLSHSPDPVLASLMHNALGVIYTQLGEWEAAHGHLQKALVIREKSHGPKSIEVARVHTSLGNLHRAQNDLDSARAAHELALAIDTAALGPKHPNLARHQHNLARVRLLQGDVEVAQALYEEALALKVAIYGPAHPEVGMTHNSLGILHERDARYPPARAHYEKAVAMLGAQRPVEAVMVRLNLARILTDAGERRAARSLLDAAKEFAAAMQHVALSGKVDEALAYLASDPPFSPHGEAGAPAPRPRPARLPELAPVEVPQPSVEPRVPPASGPSPEPAPPKPSPPKPSPPKPSPPKPQPPKPSSPKPSPPKPRPGPADAYMPGQSWD